MTQYTKPTVLPAWGESAGGADVLQPTNAEIQAGWPLSNVPPSRKRFNWILKYLAQGVRYMMQMGIPVWDATEDYPINARVMGSDGKTYKALQTSTNQSPVSAPTYWQLWGTDGRDDQLQLTTAFTTAGTAPNFTLTPVPSPSALTANLRFRVKFHAAGNGTDTINVNALGAKSIKQYDNLGAKINAVIVLNQLADLEYDGVDFVILDPLPPAPSYDTYPLSALPFPTIATATSRLTVTGNIVAGQGGTVSIGAGTYVALCEGVVAATTGRKRTFQTPAYTSGTLAVSSTYFLRAYIVAGVLTFYTQGGTDGDAIPAGLLGTPGAGTGGGFDSTCLDMLVAKVVTGVAGTTPTVTPLANAEKLLSKTVGNDSYTRVTGPTGTMSAKRNTPLTLNWARVPTLYSARTAYGITGAASSPEEFSVYYTGSSGDGTGTQTATFNRYVFDPVFGGDWNTAGTSYTFGFQTDYTVEA